MGMQIRINMNGLDDESLGHYDDGKGSKVESIWIEEPVIDIRDSGTLWLWVADNVCIELNDDAIERIHTVYIEDMKEI